MINIKNRITFETLVSRLAIPLLSLIYIFITKHYYMMLNAGADGRLFNNFYLISVYYECFIYCLALLPSFFIKLYLRKPSQLFCITFYYVVFVPVTILSPHWFKDFNQDFFSFLFISSLCFYYLCYYTYLEKPSLTITLTVDKFRLKTQVFFRAVNFLLVALFCYFLFTYKIDLENITIDNILNYKTRISSREYFYNSLLNKYIFNISVNFLCPIFTVLSLHYRKPITLALSITILFIAFVITLAKVIPLIILYLFGLYYFVKFLREKLTLIFCVAAILTHVVFSYHPLLYIALPSRIFNFHSSITAAYIDFYSENGKWRFLNDSRIIRTLFNQEERAPMPSEIGEAYFHDKNAFANENFMASAYADLGVAGIVIASILLGIFLRIYDSISRNLDPAIAISMLGSFTLILTSASLPTALLSGGGLLLLLILAFVPNETTTAKKI